MDSFVKTYGITNYSRAWRENVRNGGLEFDVTYHVSLLRHSVTHVLNQENNQSIDWRTGFSSGMLAAEYQSTDGVWICQSWSKFIVSMSVKTEGNKHSRKPAPSVCWNWNPNAKKNVSISAAVRRYSCDNSSSPPRDGEGYRCGYRTLWVRLINFFSIGPRQVLPTKNW